MSNTFVVRRKGFSEDNSWGDFIGLWRVVDEILYEDNNCLQWCYGKVYASDNNICFIELAPDTILALRSLKVDTIKARTGVSDVQIQLNQGSDATILDQLTKVEIYTRIKNSYEQILSSCLGKSRQEQEDFLFGKEERKESFFPKLKDNSVSDSEAIIRSLTRTATDQQMKYLVQQILSGNLEYAYITKDDHSVSMAEYAKILGRHLWGKDDIQSWLNQVVNSSIDPAS